MFAPCLNKHLKSTPLVFYFPKDKSICLNLVKLTRTDFEKIENHLVDAFPEIDSMSILIDPENLNLDWSTNFKNLKTVIVTFSTTYSMDKNLEALEKQLTTQPIPRLQFCNLNEFTPVSSYSEEDLGFAQLSVDDFIKLELLSHEYSLIFSNPPKLETFYWGLKPLLTEEHLNLLLEKKKFNPEEKCLNLELISITQVEVLLPIMRAMPKLEKVQLLNLEPEICSVLPHFASQLKEIEISPKLLLQPILLKLWANNPKGEKKTLVINMDEAEQENLILDYPSILEVFLNKKIFLQ